LDGLFAIVTGGGAGGGFSDFYQLFKACLHVRRPFRMLICYDVGMKDKRFASILIGLLVIQFLLGMLANLYASIPEHRPYIVFHQLGYVLLHALNGTLLVILGIIMSFKSRGGASFKPAVGGMTCTVLAYVFGELFVFTQNDVFSLMMAFAFVGSLLAYARIAFSSHLDEK
jgi:hypothetical protein